MIKRAPHLNHYLAPYRQCMSQSKRILVVDDEPNIREVVSLYLRREGFEVETAADGHAAMAAIEARLPDLVVLDLMLPGIDGMKIARLLRDAAVDIPIIMLTARGEEADRIDGLEVGADDYVTKPFSPKELAARVKAVLRRAGSRPLVEAEAPPLARGRILANPTTRQVFVGGQEVILTAKEFDLLWLLLSHPGRVFSRSQLLDLVWGHDFYGDPSTVTVHIRRLREKIEENPNKPRLILTVWGVGYRFAADE